MSEVVSRYSIKDLETLSGIKAHTLRIWEQRYNIIEPKRTDTNIRLYDDSDLKLILNISLLNQNGYKISRIATMSTHELCDEVLKITDKNLSYPEQIYALTLSMIDMDEARFEKVMSKNILQFGLEKTMINIVYPFLNKVGLMWQTGTINPAQEHFMSNLIRQKIVVAIDGQYSPSSEKTKKYLLFLPEGELHELSLLFSHYLIKSRQRKSYYLGQSVPFNDLMEVYSIHQPEYLVSVFTNFAGPVETQKYIQKLGASFPKAKIILSGMQIIGQDFDLMPNVLVMNKMDDLIDFIEND